MTENERSIIIDDIMGQIRAYNRGFISEKELYDYIEITLKLVEVEAEKTQMQKDYEDTQKIIGGK